MSQPHKTEDLARRDLLRLGLAGASMLVLGSVYTRHAVGVSASWSQPRLASAGG